MLRPLSVLFLTSSYRGNIKSKILRAYSINLNIYTKLYKAGLQGCEAKGKVGCLQRLDKAASVTDCEAKDMEPHVIELPRKILVGRGVAGKIPELLKALGIQGRILILADRTTTEIAGSRIQEQLGAEFEADLEPVRESSLQDAERIRESCTGVSCIIGVGGGGVIDVGKKLSSDTNSAFISVPTAPSHDGIASERISLTDGRAKHSLRGRPPTAIVADIEILMNAPSRLIASGCADAVSNYTAVFDWRLARKKGEYYSEYAGNLALLSAETVMKSAGLIRQRKERGIRNLVEALISSGISMSLAGSSRPASGAEHMFSHALDMLGSKGLHGEQCGVGSILMACLQGQDWRMIRDKLKTIGAPVTAGELGAGREMIIKALLDARKIRRRHTILDKKPLTREKAEELCKATGVL